ncbi:MAG: type II CAAX endopeptidase family protein [Terracidiphilus sp.]|jgi:membrane protease YdiL (CAAX protease family)
MRTLVRRILAVLWAGTLGFLIIVVGAGVWSALVAVNLSMTPAVPWAVPFMSVVLVLLWIYMAGKGWPRSTSQARRQCLRANLVSTPVFAWSMLAGALSVVALAGLWIVMMQMVRMPGNALPDLSHYPLFTVVCIVIMGSVAAPLTEEPAFRGYCQVILERNFGGSAAVVLSSILFALAHGPTQGFVWPKLLFYFLVGVVFGATAYLTNSILPAIPGHVFGLLIFFTLIWPGDAARPLIWESGSDIWFWAHVLQTVVFGAAAILAFQRLATVSTSGARAKLVTS